MTTRKRLGQLLVEAGLLDEYQLKSALGFQKKWGGRLGQVLVDNHFLTEEALVQALKQQTGLAVVDLEQRNIPDYLLALVPAAVAEAHGLIPIALEGAPGQETLVVAMADPTHFAILDELRARLGKRVRPVVASEGGLGRAIARCYRGKGGAAPGRDLPASPRAPTPAPGREDMRVVQGRLEAPPQPGALSTALDPFAELDALAQGSRPVAAAPAPPAPPRPADPFVGFGVAPHPAATPFELDVQVAALAGAGPAAGGSPPPAPGGEEPSEEIELELVEEIVELGPAPVPEKPPEPAQPPDGEAYFSGQDGVQLPPELADAFAAEALEAVSGLEALGVSEPPGGPVGPAAAAMGRPADLSALPDLDPPGAPHEPDPEPIDLSLDPEAEEAAVEAPRDSEPTMVSRLTAQLARQAEARRSGQAEPPRPSQPERPSPAPASPSAPASTARPAAARAAPARSTVAEVEPPSARPKTGSGRTAPGSPAMQALLAKVGIRKDAEDAGASPGPAAAAPAAAQGSPSAVPPGPAPEASLDEDPPARGAREAPTMIMNGALPKVEESTHPRALASDDPALRALIRVLAAKGLVTEQEILEELQRG